jgi:hypothetical protein
MHFKSENNKTYFNTWLRPNNFLNNQLLNIKKQLKVGSLDLMYILYCSLGCLWEILFIEVISLSTCMDKQIYRQTGGRQTDKLTN